MKKLTNAEWNVVQKLTQQAKMSWLWLRTDSQGNDYIYDLEDNQNLTLSEGIAMLNDGLTDLSDYDLTPAEVQTYRSLITKLEMEDR